MSNTSLLQALKDKLCITWDDSNIDRKVSDILDRGISAIIFKLGLPDNFSFDINCPETNLLLNYCFYEYNDAIDEFDYNYRSDILQLRAKNEVFWFAKEE